MYHYSLRKSVPLAALLALAVFGGSAAHAGQNVFDPNGTASQLGAGAVPTAPYSVGTPSGVDNINTVSSPYHVTTGGQTVTFTATTGSVFESYNNQGAFDFASGTQLLNTFDPVAKANTGPLEIDFSYGVTAFGLSAQSATDDMEQFTFDTYNGATQVGHYQSPLFNNDGTQGFSKSVFLGAQATSGDVFTKVIINSTSFVGGVEQVDNDNDFYFGPLNTVPVPEASSMVSLGMALALLGGVTLIARRRRVSRAS